MSFSFLLILVPAAEDFLDDFPSISRVQSSENLRLIFIALGHKGGVVGLG
jgi:hypothetical protein